ncbi:MAG: DUF3311 domain-containing protein [Conexivisphaerales archaeon]
MQKRRYAPIVFLLLVFAAYLYPWYNFTEPRLGGLPFFYWYIIVMFAVSSILLFLYTALAKKTDPAIAEV